MSMDISLALVVYLAVLAKLCHAAKCPVNPASAVQKCASKININLNNAEGHKFLTDSAYTKKLCEGSEVSDAIKCMDDVYKRCVKGGVKVKDLIMKPSSWKAGLKEICDNSQFLVDNAECMTKASAELTTCVDGHTAKASKDIQLKAIDVATDGNGNQSQADVFKLVCGLSKKIRKCFDKTLLKHCPKKMETLIDDVLHHFLPPVCHPGGDNDNNKGSYETVRDGKGDNSASTVSVPASLILAVLLCLLNFR